VVTGNPDDPLDVNCAVALKAEACQHVAEEAAHRIAGSWLWLIPRAGAVEHHDVPARDSAEIVDELVHDYAVARQEGVFHRLRRDAEDLDDEGLEYQRENESGCEYNKQFPPPGPAGLLWLTGLLGLGLPVVVFARGAFRRLP
jgi:hypothetical protein